MWRAFGPGVEVELSGGRPGRGEALLGAGLGGGDHGGGGVDAGEEGSGGGEGCGEGSVAAAEVEDVVVGLGGEEVDYGGG